MEADTQSEHYVKTPRHSLSPLNCMYAHLQDWISSALFRAGKK